MAGDDLHLWLENIQGTEPMKWVKAQNTITAKRFMESSEFKHTRERILEVLHSDARIPYPNRMGNHLYNFWQDRDHPRGVWRRTTLYEYRKGDPQWETVIDIDALNKAENAHWVFKGADCLKPEYKRSLVSLSSGGGDAVETRKFALPTKTFVKDGFRIPVAKTKAGWIDADTLYVGTDFGPGSMTDSGYPRIVKEWKRGIPLASAATVYEGKATDLEVTARHDNTPGFGRDFVNVWRDTFHSEIYLRKGGKLVRVDVPSDASPDPHREWLLVAPRSRSGRRSRGHPASPR